MAIFANTIRPFSERYGLKADYKEKFEKCGANTGNVVFHDAILQQIKFDKEIISYAELETAKESSVYVLPAANWINRNGNVLRGLFGNLDHSHIRILVLGLGIQMKLGESIRDFADSLSKETVSALKIMSEHSVLIGIRGEKTGAVLDYLGIHNWQIIGCPSYYEPYRKNIMIKNSKNASLDKIQYNIKSNSKKVNKIFDYCRKGGGYIVVQGEGDMIVCKQAGWEDVLYFNNRKEWEDFLRDEDISFSTGLRFHGNMMALSCGIPALWIINDERMQEMVEAMKLPYIYEHELDNINNPDVFMGLTNYDEKFMEYYKQMGEEYIKFLEKNGVEHNFEKHGNKRCKDSEIIL